jgi:hypothetical protein
MPPIACGPAAERAGNGLDSNCFCRIVKRIPSCHLHAAAHL